MPFHNTLHSHRADPNAVEALITHGISAAEAGDLKDAENAFQNAADQCRKIDYPSGLARALHHFAASVLVTQGKFDLALTYLEEAHAIRSEMNLKDWGWPWVRAYIYLLHGKRRQARRALDELVREIEPATRSAGSYYFLWARLAMDEDEYEKAHEYLRLGMRIATQTGIPDLNLWMRIEHSRFYRKTNQPSTAREWAEDAVHMAQRFNLPNFRALALVEYAEACRSGGEDMLSKQSLAEAETLFTQIGASYNLAYIRYLNALWNSQDNTPDAPSAWLSAAQSIRGGGYAFILEKEQETAFPLIAAYLRSSDSEIHNASETLLQDLSKVPPPALRIAGLGQFAVWKGRKLIPERSWQKRKAGDLFRYLVLQPNRSAGKEAILEALWPDYAPDSGSDLLHQSTSALRRILEPDLPDKFRSRYLSFEGEQIELQLPPGTTVDFEIFHRDLPIALQNKDLDLLMDAIRLYTGELFPADRYTSFCQEQRTNLSELYQEGLLALAKLHYQKLQFADALDCCRQVTRLDAWNEDAVQVAMRCYIELGTPMQAMRQYLRLEAILRDELQIQPHPDLKKLADTIRNRS